MNPFRKCCGYYCAMIMFIGILFYIVAIGLEVSNNYFMANKLQEKESWAKEKTHARWNEDWEGNKSVKQQQKDIASDKVISMAIAIGVINYSSYHN